MRNRGILCSIIIFSVCGLFQGDSAPFPPPCRCQQNGGVKQKFVVVAAMVGQQLPCALRRAMCPASGAAVPRGRCTTAFSHPSPLLCRASFPFKSSHHPELLSRFPTDPPCRMGRVSFGPPESCSWRVPLGERLVATFRLAGCVRRLSPVGKVRIANTLSYCNNFLAIKLKNR